MSKTEDFQSDLTFPADLGSGKTSAKNSVALFSARLKKDKEFSYYIYLPAPTGLAVNDQANYNTTDFGLAGAENKFGAGTITQTLKMAGIKAGRLLPNFAVEDAQIEKSFAGAIVNPNTNTTFGGNGVRSFTFAYKFIPESQAEAQTIKQIIRRFKALSYAALGNSDKENPASLILTYPPVWQIKFLTSGAGGSFSENPFMPKLFDCYLTGVETNYNPAANIFFKGGAPNEIDISVTYQETRALTRNDIDELENTVDQEGDFNNPSDNNKVVPPKTLNFSSRSNPGRRNVRNRGNN